MSPPFFPKDGSLIPCGSIKHRGLASQEVRPWASLPEDLVQLIGWQVLAGDLMDYVRFRAVCTLWSSSTLRPGGRGLLDPRFHPRRWMMLPEGHGLYPGHPRLGGYVRFFNLSTGAFVRVHLPLFDDHIVLDSVDGLLVLLLHRDHGNAIRLLHPFTGDIAKLPPLVSILPQIRPQARYDLDISEDRKLRELYNILMGVSAAVSVSASGAISVMLALDMKRHVAHATAGDQLWTVSAWELPFLLASTVPFQGKLYTVSPRSRDRTVVGISQIDPPQPNSDGSLQPPRIIAECPLVGSLGTAVHLVECGSELMLVGFPSNSQEQGLVVYRLADLVSGRNAPVTSIGDDALFLGERSICVSPNRGLGLPSVLGNTITCQRAFPVQRPQVGAHRRRPLGLRRVEQYHLGSGTWSPATDEDIISCSDTSVPSPYMLVHHIYTCCYRGYWNNGIMFQRTAVPDWSVKPNLWADALRPIWNNLNYMRDLFLPRCPEEQLCEEARARKAKRLSLRQAPIAASMVDLGNGEEDIRTSHGGGQPGPEPMD